MANIRFVKSTNDNRIRSLPSAMMINDVIEISPSAPDEAVCITTSKMNEVIHITTPKRNVSHTSAPDIFTRSKNNNYQSKRLSSSPISNQTCNNSNNNNTDNIDQANENFKTSRNQSLQKTSPYFPANINQSSHQDCMDSNLNSVSSSDKDLNSNLPPKTEKNDNHFMKICENKKLKYKADGKIPEKTRNIDEVSEKTTDIHDIRGEITTNQGRLLTENPKEKDQAKRPVMKFKDAFDTMPNSDLSDVLDEEVDHLPEISKPGSAVMFNTCQKTQLHQQQEQQRFHKHDDQKQKSTSSSSRQQQNRQASNFLENSTGNKHIGRSRPIHRSISDAALVDSDSMTSFFRSINDAKYYGLDKEEFLGTDDMPVNLDEKGNSSNLTEPRRFTQPAKIAWDTGINQQRSVNILDKMKDKETWVDSGRPPVSKPGESHFIMSRSLSGDSVMTDRLRMRRCALADPGNMIMRQEVREKIEKEVEKRRSSMVRRISQYFNIRLGLNKEEDLI